MKFAHKLTLALLVVLAVVLSLCNTVLIGQQFRQELHTAQETLSADWQRESRAMQRTLVTPGSGSLAARVGSYLQAITEQNSLACAAYSVDGTSLYYALPTAVPLSEVEALLAQDGEPRMVLANNHTLLCAGTVVLPERCITLVIAQDAAPRVAGAAGPHPKCIDRRTFGHGAGRGPGSAALPPHDPPAGAAGAGQPPDCRRGLQPAHGHPWQ